MRPRRRRATDMGSTWRAVGRDRFGTAAVLAVTFLAGCTVGPDYHRPGVQTPQTFRAPAPLPEPQAGSLADLRWWEVFQDEKLQDLIRAALINNYDLREAVAR